MTPNHGRRRREKLGQEPKSAVVTVPFEVPAHYAEFWESLVRQNKIKALNPELSEQLIDFIIHDVINDLRYETTRRDFIGEIREQLAFGEISLHEAQDAIKRITGANYE